MQHLIIAHIIQYYIIKHCAAFDNSTYHAAKDISIITYHAALNNSTHHTVLHNKTPCSIR